MTMIEVRQHQYFSHDWRFFLKKMLTFNLQMIYFTSILFWKGGSRRSHTKLRPRSFISLQGCEHHHATFISWEHETDRPAWNTILCCRQAQIGAGGLFQHRWTQVGPDCSRWDTRARGVGFPFELFSPWTWPVLITSILKVNTDLMSRHIYTHTHTHTFSLWNAEVTEKRRDSL